MKVLKIGFVGTRTDQPAAMVDFFERTLALRPMHGGDDMWAFRLPDGSIAEVFIDLTSHRAGGGLDDQAR